MGEFNSALALVEPSSEDGSYVRHYADENLLDPNEFRDVHTRAKNRLLIRRHLENTFVMLEFDMETWEMVGETECYPEFPVEWDAPVGVAYGNGALLSNARSLLSTDRSIGWLGDSYVFPAPICELNWRSSHENATEHPSLAIPLGGNSVLMYLNRVEGGLIIDPITGPENACICRVTFL